MIPVLCPANASLTPTMLKSGASPVQTDMGDSFRVAIARESGGVVTLTIGFGAPADNTPIVPDAIAAMASLRLPGGRGIHFNGPASLPVAMALTHAVAHLYGYVACYDPKLRGYVVAISHDPMFWPGHLLPVNAALE